MNELKSLGWKIVDPVIKTLACNVVGMGAMAHVEDIVSYINNVAEARKKKILQWNDALDKPSYSSSSAFSSASVIASIDILRVTAFQKENDKKNMNLFKIMAVAAGILLLPVTFIRIMNSLDLLE